MTIEIRIKNPVKSECFATIFQHVKLFTDTINIMFEKERMYIQSMDTARISIFEVAIPASWFDEYIHTMDQGITIGVCSSILYKILNTRDKVQETRLSYDPVTATDKLEIHFTSPDNKSVFDRQFEMPLLDLEYEVMAIPETDSQAEFSISSTNFANIVNQLKIFGDTLEVECDEERITLNSVSQESGKMTVKINIDDLTTFSINEGETLRLSFSLANLHNICMYSKLAKEVEVHFTENFPMKMVYYFGDSPDDRNTRLSFFLAPKISDDDI
jgi:proliferating cell nuclear antigen PCNA